MKSETKLIVTIALVAAIGIGGFASGFVVGGGSNASTARNFILVDDYGRVIALEGFAKRIVSVSPTPTEIIFSVGAGDLLVGVDAYSDYPNATANITKVGDFQLNVEKIISLKPDIIISSDLVSQNQLDGLSVHGIPYMILAARNISDVYKDMRLIGQLTNHSKDANDAVAALKVRVKNVTDITLASNVSHPKVYLEYWPLWTYGSGSFGDDLITLAGGSNIAHNETPEYLAVGPEFVVSKDPDIIIYTVGASVTTTKADITSRPGWSNIDAVINDRILTADDNLVSRYGPRIVDGLEALAALIHPELFP